MSDYYESLPEVVKVKADKMISLTEQGRYPYAATRFDSDALASDIIDEFEKYEGRQVKMSGRIMAKRGQGKVAFFDLQDSSGRIQLFIRADAFDESEYARILAYDIGDIIGIGGEVFRTQRGQISVRPSSVEMLSKSIQILPEKFHGLKDTDLRYRQRYVDLIVNPQVRETFRKRSDIIKAVREFMDQKGFLEVETPVLSTLAGGAAARPFVTHHNTLDIPMYLRIALEL